MSQLESDVNCHEIRGLLKLKFVNKGKDDIKLSNILQDKKHVRKYHSIFRTDLQLLLSKTAVCIGDQLLDFSVAELVQSQSTFSTFPEVLQICPGFTLFSSAGLAVMGLIPCML